MDTQFIEEYWKKALCPLRRKHLSRNLPEPEMPYEGSRTEFERDHDRILFSTPFRRLIDKVGLGPDDQLFLLGDYIHKGPDSKGVIDQILSLMERGYQVYPLRGNHEQMLLDHHLLHKKRDYEYVLLGLSSRKPLLDAQRMILPQYRDFFAHLPYYYELDGYYLCHAGIDCLSPRPFQDFKAMLWQHEFSLISEVVNHKKVVYGHVPQQMSQIKQRLAADHPKICLDGGAVYPKRPGMGNLICFDLDARTITAMPNFES